MDSYRGGVSAEDRERYEGWLGVERIYPAAGRPRAGKGYRQVVSATLFWKHVMGFDPELPVPTRERLALDAMMAWSGGGKSARLPELCEETTQPQPDYHERLRTQNQHCHTLPSRPQQGP